MKMKNLLGVIAVTAMLVVSSLSKSAAADTDHAIPVTGESKSATPETPTSFTLPADSNNRLSQWVKTGPENWEERYADGTPSFHFRFMGRTTIDGIQGTIYRREQDFEVFLPDMGTNSNWAHLRVSPNSEWIKNWRKMTNVSAAPIAQSTSGAGDKASSSQVPTSFTVLGHTESRWVMWLRTGADTWEYRRFGNPTKFFQVVTHANLNVSRFGGENNVHGTFVREKNGTDEYFIPDVDTGYKYLEYRSSAERYWHKMYLAIDNISTAPLTPQMLAATKGPAKMPAAPRVPQTYQLVDAAAKKDWPKMMAILEKDPMSAREASGERTALYWAAMQGQNEICKALLDKGADPNSGLYSAIMGDRSSTVSLLVGRGANVNPMVKRPGNLSPLGYAIQFGNLGIAKFLVDKGAFVNGGFQSRSPIFAVASADKNHLELVKLLKSKGANLNVGAGQGTPLHKAVENGNKNAAEALKANGADLRAKNSEGYTPSEYARLVGNPVLADLLRP